MERGVWRGMVYTQRAEMFVLERREHASHQQKKRGRKSMSTPSYLTASAGRHSTYIKPRPSFPSRLPLFSLPSKQLSLGAHRHPQFRYSACYSAARLPSTSERTHTHTHIDPRERKTRAMPPSADRGPSPLRPPTTPFRLDSQMSPIDKDLHPVIHSGRVAVVTGAASGIGAAAAREFAKSVSSRSSRA